MAAALHTILKLGDAFAKRPHEQVPAPRAPSWF
jgi:hypothetical protein